MKKILTKLAATGVAIIATAALPSCSCDDSSALSRAYLGVPLVIVDTDIGASTDELFALEMAYRYVDQGRCRLLGVVVNREGQNCAACADVMDTYFNYGHVPIALVRKGVDNPSVYIDYRALPNYKKADHSPMFGRGIGDYSSLPDGWQLYRRLLADQPDGSVSICCIGYLACLAQLLQSGADDYSPLSGIELVRQKVKCLYLQGGAFADSSKVSYNFSQGKDFAQTVFSLWPSDVDIIFSPGEVGASIEYAPDQVIADISWTDYHPVKQVYMTCNCNTGQKMWDPLVVINAVEGNALFTLSERGTVTLTPEAVTLFTPTPNGNCRYQMPGTPAWSAAMLEKIRDVNKKK